MLMSLFARRWIFNDRIQHLCHVRHKHQKNVSDRIQTHAEYKTMDHQWDRDRTRAQEKRDVNDKTLLTRR